MFPTDIETARLELTQFCPDRIDVFELYDRFAASTDGVDRVFEYVPQEPYRSLKEARDQLTEAEKKWREQTAAWYAVFTPEAELAGYTVLTVEWERRSGELGLILAEEFWGNGYASECWHALTELAFDRLDLELVAAGHEEGNDRSKRAIETFAETAGGQYDGVIRNRTPIGTAVLDHHRYTIRQDQYTGRD